MSIDLSNFSQIQQYYIQKQLPEFSSVKEAPRQKKDHHYYNDNFNIWNNRAQTAQKNYAFYHQQVDQGKPIIEKQKDKEIIDKLVLEEQRKDFIIMQKQIDKERLQSRKRERMALQLESMQDIVSKDPREFNSFVEMTNMPSHLQSHSTNNLVHTKSSAKQNQNPILGRAPHQWNKFNQSSKKFIDQTVNPKIIKKDEEAVHLISQRIQRDRDIEALKYQSYEKIHDQTRQTFLKQHQKNVDFEAKCGLLPKEKPIVLIQSKLNAQTLIPLKKKIIGNVSLKNGSQPNLYQTHQIQSPSNQNNEKRNSIAYSQVELGADDLQNRLEEFGGNQNGQVPNSARLEENLSARKKLESSQKPHRKAQSQSIQGILSINTNNIHKQLQYSTLPYNEDTEKIKGDNIVIQYNNKDNQQSKQQVDQINFGDEKEQKNSKGGNRRKSSLAKQSDQSDLPSILKQGVQTMAVNAKSQRVNSFHGDNFQTNGKVQNADQYQSEREFLTSAESHAKKAVNFQQNAQINTQFSEKNLINNTSSFVQKNLDDVQSSNGQVKFRRIDQLSQPKSKEYQPKEFLERSEYKGLLTTELNNINVNSDTEFARAMMMNSQIVNSHIYNSQRPQTRQSKISKITQTNTNTFSFMRPSTTASGGSRSIIYKNPQNISSSNLNALEYCPPSVQEPYNSMSNIPGNRIHSLKNIHKLNAESTIKIEQKNEVLSEIDSFEQKYQFVKENRVGFSKSNLMKFQQKETFMSAKSALGQK